jgi:hypothetical protein
VRPAAVSAIPAIAVLILSAFGAAALDTGGLPTWAPGIPGGIPAVPVVANVRDFVARRDVASDEASAIQAAIDSIRGDGAVLIPAGTYLLRSSIRMRKGVVLRGDGAGRTHLMIDHNADAIVFLWYDRGPWTPLVGGLGAGLDATRGRRSLLFPSRYVRRN